MTPAHPQLPAAAFAGGDQASGLRQLFGAPAARLLPILLPSASGACQRYTAWLARLGEAFARAGQHCLLVDAARSQVAATLGLRARFDLAHANAGECSHAAARLDAGEALSVLPAARAAAEALAQRAPLSRWLAPALPEGTEFVLLACTPAQTALLPEGDVVVPLLADRHALGPSLDALAQAVDRAAATSTSSGAFRLLFLGMEPAAAATLAQRLGIVRDEATTDAVTIGAVAGAVPALAQVVHCTSRWRLASLAVPARHGILEKML